MQMAARMQRHVMSGDQIVEATALGRADAPIAGVALAWIVYIKRLVGEHGNAAATTTFQRLPQPFELGFLRGIVETHQLAVEPYQPPVSHILEPIVRSGEA